SRARTASDVLGEAQSATWRAAQSDAWLRGLVRLRPAGPKDHSLGRPYPERRTRAAERDLDLRSANGHVRADRHQPRAARPLLCAADRLRPDRQPLPPLPFLRRQPRLALVSGELPVQHVRLELRSGIEDLAEHAATARAGSFAAALRFLGC